MSSVMDGEVKCPTLVVRIIGVAMARIRVIAQRVKLKDPEGGWSKGNRPPIPF